MISALGIDQPQRAVGELDGLVLVDQAQVVGGEVGEDLDLRLEGAGDLLVGGQRQLEVGIGLGNHGQNLVAVSRGERLGDAAGDYPPGMDALGAEQLDDVLAEAAQSDAGQAQVGPCGGDAEDVARRGVGLHAQQQIRRGEMEEAQGVRLDHLGHIQQAAQLRGGMRNADRHDGFAGLGGGQQVRDRADAADARREAGHLVKRAAFTELLKAAHLGDVKVRVLDLALGVELDGDLAVAFEAGYGIDGDGLGHDSGSKAGEG